MADKMVTNSCKSNRKYAELKYYFLNVCRYFNLVISVENKITANKKLTSCYNIKILHRFKIWGKYYFHWTLHDYFPHIKGKSIL
jgi:hypothetical protein